MKTSIFLNKFEMFIVYLLDLNNVTMDLLHITLNTHQIRNHVVIFTFTQFMFTIQCIVYTTTDPLTLTLFLSSYIYWLVRYEWSSSQHLKTSQWVLTAFTWRFWCSGWENTTWYFQIELGILSKDFTWLTSLSMEPRQSTSFLIRNLISVWWLNEWINLQTWSPGTFNQPLLIAGNYSSHQDSVIKV